MVMMILHQYKIKFLSIQSIKWCKLQKLFIKNQEKKNYSSLEKIKIND